MSDFIAPAFPARSTLPSRREGMRPYPLGGRKTGPAWDAMWRAMLALDPKDYATDESLRKIGAEAGECTEGTAKVLLIRACNAGLLEKTYDTSGSRTKVCYRIAKYRKGPDSDE